MCEGFESNVCFLFVFFFLFLLLQIYVACFLMFVQKVDNVVPTKCNSKNHPEYEAARVIQHLVPHHGPVWTFKFSPDGCYLATAGQDSIVRVWYVNSKG